MKGIRKLDGIVVVLLLLLLTVYIGCATSAKSLLVTRNSFNDALVIYRADLKAQDAATQELWHDRYDDLIIAAQAALDGWQKFVLGETTSSSDYAEFLVIKNKLIAAGWNYFKEDK